MRAKRSALVARKSPRVDDQRRPRRGTRDSGADEGGDRIPSVFNTAGSATDMLSQLASAWLMANRRNGRLTICLEVRMQHFYDAKRNGRNTVSTFYGRSGESFQGILER